MSIEGFVAARLSATPLSHSSPVGRGDESVHFCCIGALFAKRTSTGLVRIFVLFFMSVTGERFYGIEAGGATCRQVAEKDTNGS